MTFDRDDRAALARLAVYAGLFALAITAILLGALALGAAVHLFRWAAAV